MSTVLKKWLVMAREGVQKRAVGPRHRDDHWADIPPRLPLRVWAVALAAFLSVYLFTFMHVHVVADTRICRLRLDDPLMRIIPHTPLAFLITTKLYVIVTLTAIVVLFAQAYLGDERPIVRWGFGLAICGFFRSISILLVPLCRYSRVEGTAVLSTTPTLDLGFIEIPWRMFATSDMLFSGHICEFVLLIRATRSWPRWARAVLWTFQLVQIVALLSGRGHYTVDIALAIPIAIGADHMSHTVVRKLVRAQRSPSGTSEN